MDTRPADPENSGIRRIRRRHGRVAASETYRHEAMLRPDARTWGAARKVIMAGGRVVNMKMVDESGRVALNETSKLVRHPTPSSGTESATRVADVLLVFSAKQQWVGVTEIAECLSLNKAVVHRILRSLESRRFVVADGSQGRYSLGPAAAAMGARALGDLDLRKAAMPVLRRLQAETSETATVSVLLGTARTYLDQVVSPQEIKMTVELGRPFPLYLGASSKALLAASPEDVRQQVLADAELEPARLERLEQELHQIACTGVAHSSNERQAGAASVASAVFGPDERVVGCISLCGPAARFEQTTVTAYEPLIRDAAREVSQRLLGE